MSLYKGLWIFREFVLFMFGLTGTHQSGIKILNLVTRCTNLCRSCHRWACSCSSSWRPEPGTGCRRGWRGVRGYWPTRRPAAGTSPPHLSSPHKSSRCSRSGSCKRRADAQENTLTICTFLADGTVTGHLVFLVTQCSCPEKSGLQEGTLSRWSCCKELTRHCHGRWSLSLWRV